MQREPRLARWQPLDGDDTAGTGFGPLDAELEALDAQLRESGTRARRALDPRTQPTRFFANALRERLFRPPRPGATGR